MIKIDNVSFRYDSKNLFDNLSLEVKDGAIYGLLGRNGAGKTTLLKIITGLIFPKSGTPLVSEELSNKRQVSLLKNLYFIPESYTLPEITTRQYEKLYSPLYPNFDKELFYKKLEEFEISPDNKLTNLSFGQKKRFLFVFGVSSNCDILIFDEPTNGLDIPSKRIIKNNLLDLRSKGKTILISTHNVKEMEGIFDNIKILENGKIIFESSIETIKSVFVINTLPKNEDITNAIYYEEIPGGYSLLTRNDSYNSSEVDLEFFFNAVIKKRDIINQLISQR